MTVDILGTPVESYGSGVPSRSVSFTLLAGFDRILIISGMLSKSGTKTRTITSATYGGVGLTEAVSQGVFGTNHSDASIWYLLEADLPANGANNGIIYVEGGDTAEVGINVYCFENCLQEAPHITDTYGVAAATTTTPNTVSGIRSNSAVVQVVSGYGSGAPFTPDSGYSEIHETTIGATQWKQVANDGTVTYTHASRTYRTGVMAAFRGVGGIQGIPIFY